MSISTPPTLDIGQTLARAQAHWNAGQADKAEMACAQVLAVWPGQCDAMHLMGLMAHAYGNLDLAIANLRQACQSPRAPGLYYSNFAEMCRQRGLLAEGEQAARRAVAINPQLAGGWNNLGIILQESGKLDESRACLERMLTLEPDNAQALNNLANTCKRLGRPEEAERLWSRAIALQPNYAEVYSNLSNLLVERSGFARARELARKAIDLNPRLADAYINLAAVEMAEHRFMEALRWLRALLDFAPDHVGGLVALAFALRESDEPEAALEAAQRAVAMSPQSAEAANALGLALQAGDQAEAAVAAFTRAASLPGTTRGQSLGNVASLNMEIGRKDVAQAQYEALVAEFPLSASDLMLVHFGLGKALGDIGDSVGAFHHFDIGNSLKRATISYDPDGVSQWMRDIAAAYPATSLEGNGGCPSAMPIFVLGMPRSGTTLVEQILASHAAIHGAGELRLIQQMVDGLGAFPRDFAALTAAQRTQFGEAYIARLGKLAHGHAHVVDKMPANFLYAGLIRQMLPGARIIHCRRDPVDTCLSCYSNLFAGEQAFTYDQVELGRFHRDYQELMAHWRAILPETHFLEVDYEAVVDDLEGQARRMLAFLGLPWDPACLEFHRTARPVRTASVNQVREPIYRSSTGKWRQHAAQLQPLLEALGIAAP